MTETNCILEVSRKDPAATRCVDEPLADLEPGRTRFAVDRFALTANNVTYAVTGDLLGYWDFFPADEPWGRVPAMGWGTIVASAHPEITVGGRYYGWFPMAQHVDLEVSATADGLRDDGAHRAAHAPVYRAYTSTDRDPFYRAGEDAEDRHALLRGLFVTAFLADDHFAEHGYHGASRVVVLSASSKTAIGFAQRASTRGLDEVVGLTSPGNVDFVASLEWYDRVIAYGDLETLPVDADTVSIDMSGNGAVLERIHAHYGDRLRYSMAIGRSHHDAPPPTAVTSGPRPEFFFAPAQVKKRLQVWGPAVYQERAAAALEEFVDASRRWLEVTRSSGPEAAQATWRAVHAGSVPPSVGHVVSL